MWQLLWYSVQHMTDELRSLRADLNELQHLIDQYKNQSYSGQIESRM